MSRMAFWRNVGLSILAVIISPLLVAVIIVQQIDLWWVRFSTRSNHHAHRDPVCRFGPGGDYIDDYKGDENHE